jgi:acyl transferase domain-containing protein/thioesterase domain-containing protein/acyl carrier protein
METDREEIDAGSIAIVGLAGRFPSARTTGELWDMLRDGREATTWKTDDELRAAGVPEDDLKDPDYVRAALVLPDMEMFDAGFFGFSKRDAAVLDPQHRHFLECAWEALEDAGHMPENFPGAIGVFGGCGMQAYLPYNLMTNPDLVKSMGLFLLRHTGNDKDFLTSRVSYLLDLKGPSMSIQTACSTSLVAVHVAAQSLLSGECDMALAGGVSIDLPHGLGYKYAAGEIMSPDGHCRAFDENASGTIFGSGAGIVVLRRLSDAVRDGDNIYAVIRGSAVNNDGYQKAGYLAPSVDGQARAAVEALAVSGVDAASVSYIEAHGTGTPVGDPIEVAALKQAYGGGAARCGIGSLKTNIGHLDTAAGVASLIKVSLALRHGLIPATLNFSQANSRLDIGNTPFYVMAQAKSWGRSDKPRIAGVNSLGVGGTNAHVIVEEAPLVKAIHDGDQLQVITLSARTPTALEGIKDKWRNFLARPPEGFSVADAAYTTQAGRRQFEHRCAVVARDIDSLNAAFQGTVHERRVSAHAPTEKPSVVMMFPGGGAHFPGAGRELMGHAAFRTAVDECFALMPDDAPADLRAAMFDTSFSAGDADLAHMLEKPGYAIPALFVLEYALSKLWQSWGIVPSAVIGHSAGEYAAACLAGVMSLSDALAIVVLRGQLFETVPAGAMLAVDLPEAELRGRIGRFNLDLAAINAPDLCIASGPVDSIAQLEARLAEQDIECRRLRINVAAHSRLLDGVLETFRRRLSRVQLNPPTIPFISNLTGSWADSRTLTDPEYWVRHLREPVRYADGIAEAFALAHPVLLEVGPGQSLGGLARQNSAGRKLVVRSSTAKAKETGGDLAVMMTSVASLWTQGASPDWQAIRGAAPARRISVPTYAFDHERHWIEPGAGLPGRSELPPQAAAASNSTIKRLPSYDDWFSEPRWHAAPLTRSPSKKGGRWLVFGNQSKLTADVLSRAGRTGARVTLVHAGDEFGSLADGSFTVSPTDASHFSRLFGILEESGSLPDTLVHLWALDTIHGRAKDGLAGQALAFDSILNIGKAIAHLDLVQPMHLAAVTAGSQAVETEKVPHPERALVIGPCRVIPQEIPTITTRVIDLSPVDISSDSVADWIVEESETAAGSDLVAYRGGVRFTLELGGVATFAASKLSGRLRQAGVYLITGGLGDIGIDLAGFLSASQKARVALVGRRVLPPKTEWRKLAASGDASPEARVIRRLVACEDAGGHVMVFSADVSDRRAMAKVISNCRAHFGTINGVFHSAGVLEDGPIATKTPESVRRVMSAKAGGAQVLHELLPPGDLDLFAMFSSTSVHLAAAGQADYVAANAFLDSLAASRTDGLSIHWGIWGGQGMAARAHGRSQAGNTAHGNTGHPFLGLRVSHDDGAVFEATYSAAEMWALQEHAVGGCPVLPGTAYIEIARAAMAVMHPGSAIEIRALSFEEAMVFGGESTRLVRTELRRSTSGYDLVVRSCGMLGEPWVDHARAGVGLYSDGLADVSPSEMTTAGTWQAGTIPQKQAVAFGPRWQNIARLRLGERTAIAEMELPDRFAGDLGDFAAHPAITDMAATFGLHLIDEADRSEALFVPLSIDRIRLVAPVPRQSISRVTLKGDFQNRAAAFDMSLHTLDGKPIATFEGFSLRAVRPDAVARQARSGAVREQGLMESMLSCGIRSEDSHELFRRIFSGNSRDLVVSSIAIGDLRRAMAAAPRVTPAVRRGDGHAREAPGDADFNQVERVIADAWRELLGVETISREDDFFALGGHSLAAVRLFARIRKQFAVDLPLATLFQASTLSELSRVVSEAGGIDTTQAAAVLKKISSTVVTPPRPAWSPLVAICKGRPGEQPLFCVHGAGGNVLNFKIISDRLGPAQPFYGLQAQGVDGRLPPLTSIEAMAAQYVEAIRTVDPHGPYRLAGYSAGGVIALEMAQQLTKAGARVSLLAMIDTLSPTAARRKVSYFKKILLMRHWSLQFAMEWPGRRRRGKLLRVNYAIALEKLARGEPLPPELVDFHLFNTFVAAQALYTPEPYNGSLTLFRASQGEMQYLDAGQSLGWNEYIRGPIQVNEINGSHFSMMAEPGVSELIEGFRNALAGHGERDFASALSATGDRLDTSAR